MFRLKNRRILRFRQRRHRQIHNLKDTTAAGAAGENGVDCEQLSALSIRKTNRQGLVLGYAPFDEKHIKEGAKRLATALQNCQEKQQINQLRTHHKLC